LIPLNPYLQDATLEEGKQLMNQYRKAIKELTTVNIFTGNLLLKNFGVTPLNRVVFYGCNEINLLTSINFRTIPEPRDHYEEFSSEPYYSLRINNVFHEEFRHFLIGNPTFLKIFTNLHGELFKAKNWEGIQERLKSGKIIEVFCYREGLRLDLLPFNKYSPENIFFRYFPLKNHSIEGLFNDFLKKTSKKI
jgi:isocitrate dehydrogenase kinase/phosphatase